MHSLRREWTPGTVGSPVGRSSYKGVSGSNWGDDFDEFQTQPGSFATDWRNKGTNGSFDGVIVATASSIEKTWLVG